MGKPVRCHARGQGNSERNEQSARAFARASQHHQAWCFLAVALITELAACGSGTVGIFASANSDSGGNTVIETSLAGLRVESPKSSPARLRFNLTTEATVEFLFQVGAAAPQSMTKLVPNPQNPRVIAVGDQFVDWDFASEPGLGADFRPAVKVFARIAGVQEQPVDGVNSQTLGLGNDAPALCRIMTPTCEPGLSEVEGEVVGLAQIELQVSDSSSDLVDVVVTYSIDDAGGFPDESFVPATPADEGLVGIVTDDGDPDPPGSAMADFFWDVVEDLGNTEHRVRMRFVPTDRDELGAPLANGTTLEVDLTVDNNSAPVLQLDSSPIVLNPDRRRGIPVPFTVINEESGLSPPQVNDVVRVVLQWRTESQTDFPALVDGQGNPLTPAQLVALTNDPILDAQRRRLQIGRQTPRFFTGHVEFPALPLSGVEVRLPELAGPASALLAGDLAGKTLEILRPLRPQAFPWAVSPLLVGPVAAIPFSDGHALVLDRNGAGWRVRDFELETGATGVTLFTSGDGLPWAMCVHELATHPPAAGAPGHEHLFVASDTAIFRFRLSDGAFELRVAHQATAGFRGLAALGFDAVVTTEGSRLVRRDLEAATERTMLDGLSFPSGVVLDPQNVNRIYLAERDRVRGNGVGRVLSIELDTNVATDVFVSPTTPAGAGLERPTALALERDGAQLLVVTDSSTTDSRHELRGLPLGGSAAGRVFELGTVQETGDLGLATGPDASLLVTLPSANRLEGAGGVEQARRIVGVDPARAVVTVDGAFVPTLAPARSPKWRIRDELLVARASQQGELNELVWDSSEVQTGENVKLKVIPLDTEIGIAAEAGTFKELLAGLEVAPLLLAGSTSRPSAIAAGDLDSDGDVDLVVADETRDRLVLMRQNAAGNLVQETTELVTGVKPVSVLAIDLNRDGRLDIVSANETSGSLTIYRQVSAPFPFPTAPDDTLRTALQANAVLAADLDGNGLPDLVCADQPGNTLGLFYQEALNDFPDVPSRTLSTGDAARAILAADLDGNGLLDLVSANPGSDTLRLFHQQPLDTFLPATIVALSSGDDPVGVAAADLDGDGRLELITTSAGSEELCIFRRAGTPPVFQSELCLALAPPDPSIEPLPAVVADLDQDGDLDLYTAVGNRLLGLLQNGPLSFESIPLDLDVPGTRHNSLATSDIDGDGDTELLSTALTGADVAIVRQDGPGNLTPDPNGPLPVPGFIDLSFLPRDLLSVSDIDQDGSLDIVAANNNGNTLRVFRQDTGIKGTFSGATDILLQGARPSSVVTADLDADGRLDLVSANGNVGALSLVYQDPAGPGSFRAPQALPVGNGASSVVAVDLDGNGLLDLVTTNRASDNVSFLRQSPLGSFPPFAGSPQTTGAGSQPFASCAGDFDGDGRLDVVTANAGSNRVSLFLQQSRDVFTRRVPDLVTGNNPFSISAGDLDRDGDLDLVTANSDFFLTLHGNLSVFVGPEFASRALVDAADRSVTSVALADLNLDGRIDIAYSSVDEDALDMLRVYFQTGAGSFPPRPIDLPLPGDTPWSVVAQDLNGDQELDLLAATLPDVLTFFSSTGP